MAVATHNPAPKMAPQVLRLLEGIAAAKHLADTDLQHRNALAVILLDSTLETAFRWHLQANRKITLDEKAHRRREVLVDMMKKNSSFAPEIWTELDACYDIRCDVYHEKPALTISDQALADFAETTEFVVSTLFGLDLATVLPRVGVRLAAALPFGEIDINSLGSDIDAIAVAVDKCRPAGPAEIVTFLRKEGRRKIPAQSSVGSYLTQKAYKHLFYKEDGVWKLTGAGKVKLGRLLAAREGAP